MAAMTICSLHLLGGIAVVIQYSDVATLRRRQPHALYDVADVYRRRRHVCHKPSPSIIVTTITIKNF